MKFVNLSKQNIKYLKRYIPKFKKFVLSGNYILGENVKKLEKKFSLFNNSKYSVGVGSGTDALYLSLKYLNIKENDEVITVSNSYLSSVSSINLAGGKPVLVDVEYETLNIDPKKIIKKINKKTKAMIIVHLCGTPANMKEIMNISKKYKIPIIEDCAQAIGASIKNKKVGNFGLVGCFSFHPLKNINAMGDGGMITTNNKKMYNWLIKARNHGHPNRDECDFWSHNMRLDEIQAIFILEKLKKINQIIFERNKRAKIYMEKLNKKFVKCSKFLNDNVNVHHLFIIKTKFRDKLIKFLKKENIEVKIHYPKPTHKLNAYLRNEKKISLPITEKLSREIVSLPIADYHSKKEILNVASNINKFFKN